jgi:hypothetical protein
MWKASWVLLQTGEFNTWEEGASNRRVLHVPPIVKWLVVELNIAVTK